MRLLITGFVAVLAALAAVQVPGEAQPPQDPYAAHISSAPPRTPEEERKGFHVPPGFEVQLVAAEPFIRKPINMNFDDRGRLWVTESIEYPFPAGPDKPHRDTVRILAATRGTALADEVLTFTSGLNIPIGVLPYCNGAIIYSIPSVYRYQAGSDGDRAVSHEALLTGYGHKDTHGMTGEFTLGFDGWIYACHGFSNTSDVRARDGSHITMQSGSTYRFKPDGTHVEYFTHGQVNPFGLSLDPLGNLYSCDCHSRPIYMLLRGAYYPSFGKPHDGLGFGPEVMTHDHGSTAIAGITYYAADHFPAAYRDTIFIGNVVTNRINHDRLERHGSTVRAIQQPDFLISDDPWFRPVDIKLGPDGALYVADFYNRIIGHYEVPLTHPGRDKERGRIWRIVYRGADGKGPNPRQPRPDWGKASVEELVQDLGHPNLTVRLKATHQLAEHGAAVAESVRRAMGAGAGANAFRRMHGLWVLERVGVLDEATLQAAAKDAENGVRVHAMRILAERPWLSTAMHAVVMNGLKDSDPFVQRCAADALGRHPETANIHPLLDLRRHVPVDDTHLLHVVRMALRDQFLTGKDFPVIPATAGWDEESIRAVADVAPGVPNAESAEFLLRFLKAFRDGEANQVRYVYHIARYGTADTTRELVTFERHQPAGSLSHQAALFKSIQQGLQARGARVSEDMHVWGDALTHQLLASKQSKDVMAGIELGGLLHLKTAADPFRALVTEKAAPENQRTAAMSALMAIDAKGAVPVLGRVLGDATVPIGVREKAAHVLGGSNRADAMAELLKALPAAPQRLAVPIANGLATHKDAAAKLLDLVAAGKASARLLQDYGVRVRLERTNPPRLKERIAELTQGLPTAAQQFTELANKRRAGFAAAKKDATLGAKVFEKHCAICHQIANKGAKIGPQLDGVGIRGFDRLFEDIVEPSRNVDQAFRMTTLGLKNGQVISGLLLREEGEVYVLADNQGKEVRVPRANVDDRTLSQLSPMPANLVDQIPEGDFYNLLAFLLAQQPAKEPKSGSLREKPENPKERKLERNTPPK